MERNTLTTAKMLQIGDRFYIAKHRKKIIMQMVKGEIKKTYYQTYRYWCQADGDKYPQAIKGDTQVIFLRNVNDPITTQTNGSAEPTDLAGSVHA